MRRFLIKLAFLSGVLALAILAFAAYSFCRKVQLIDSVYSVKPNAQILCIGASHTGCSFVQTTNGCFKSLWIPSSDVRGCLFIARLLEMERRKLLNGFAYCVFETSPFCYMEPHDQSYFDRHFGFWLREFPVNWRFGESKPYYSSDVRLAWELVKFVAESPFSNVFALPVDTAGVNNTERMIRFVDRPKRWKEERLEYYLSHYKDYLAQTDALELRLRGYGVLREICRRNGIQMIVVATPLLSSYRAKVHPEAFERHTRFLDEMRKAGVWCFDAMDVAPDEDFFDPTHLTSPAAKSFTDKFLSFLEEQKRAKRN